MGKVIMATMGQAKALEARRAADYIREIDSQLDRLSQLAEMDARRARIAIEYAPPTAGERIANRYKYAGASPVRAYRRRRLWLESRLVAAERLLAELGRRRRALSLEQWDGLESLEQDLLKNEADDLLRLYRRALDRYAQDVTARDVTPGKEALL